MRLLLTGVTGLLGRNFLLEILKQNYSNLRKIQIIILGRSSIKESLELRVKKILEQDLANYLQLKIESKFINNLFDKNIICCIEYALDSANTEINQEHLDFLKKSQIDILYHIASLTDFRSGANVKKKLLKTNISGTEKILYLCNKIKTKKIVYVSSAYVSGVTSGNILPNYVNEKAIFRNPYEETKLKAEIMVKEYAVSNGIDYQIFRPSTICGRLIENPIGATPKFDVFYGWAIFFFKLKLKLSEKIDCKVSLDLRYRASKNSGLNIVPVDYVAKLMYLISIEKTKDKYFYLVNDKETLHSFYFSIILKKLNIAGVSMVDKEPENKNKFEILYYKTVGKIFDQYINCSEIIFDTTNLKYFTEKYKISPPKINNKNFSLLMDYAICKNFGLAL